MREIPLTQGEVALVDDADFDWLMRYKWCVLHHARGRGYWYAVRFTRQGCGSTKKRPRGRLIRMHRVIVSAPSRRFVDHINHNGLDNRRSNLRICTPSENVRHSRKALGNTTSRFKGVSRVRGGFWVAMICVESKQIRLGRFADEVEAALAYDTAARELHGEFAVPNFKTGGAS
jgi:hypothetical protein